MQDALSAAADAPGYPLTIGTPALREALVAWSRRRLGADVDRGHVLPSIGSKELVALLPSLLGLAPGSEVLLPRLAYPTYDAGARLAGCVPVPADDPTAHDPSRVSLVWLNSPSNPTGEVLPPERLRAVVDWAREHGVLVASDECYLELGWEAEPVSVLHPSVSGGSTEGVLALHSLSKRSNLAGYRAGFAVGDADAVAALTEARKHIGLLVPAPVQAATVAALGDDAHVAEQKARYAARRAVLLPAVRGGRLHRRALRGRPVPVGDPRRGLLGHRRGARRRRRARGARRVLRRGRRAARAPGPHRDRRAGRRGGGAPGRAG